MFKNTFILSFGILHDLIIILGITIFIPISFFLKNAKYYRISRTTIFNLNRICRNKSGQDTIVFYCSSVGEFEQSIPLINKFSDNKNRVIVFFHSKNGFEYCNSNFNYESYITPYDLFLFWTIVNNRIKPKLFIINRHEFWPGFILSAVFFSELYIINYVIKNKFNLINDFAIRVSEKVFTVSEMTNDVNNFILAGDTRIDRLINRYSLKRDEIKELKFTIRKNLPINSKLIIIGNCYSEDLNVLMKGKNNIFEHYKFLIIPSRHGIKNEKTSAITKIHKIDTIDWTNEKIVILNTIGNLFELYSCADIAWVGGGFTKGIHNCLEPHFYAIPIISGSNLNGQPDALLFKKENSLHIFENEKQLTVILKKNELFTSTNKISANSYSPSDFIFNIINENNNSS